MPKPNYEYDKRRFETFFDAVIAIILTILVLELRIPEQVKAEGLSTRQQLSTLVPSFISYIGSFLLIAGIWIDHHILCLNLERLTKRYILMNMLFILLLSIVPFTTAFAGNNPHDSFAVALLFVNYLLMNLFFASLYWYGMSKGLLPREFYKDQRAESIYSIIGIICLALAIPLAYLNTYLSFGMAIVVFAGHLLKAK